MYITRRSLHAYHWYRAAGGLRTIRWWCAYANEYRYWDTGNGPRPPKLRELPKVVWESNYGEYRHSWFRFDRWVAVRATRIESRAKLTRLYNRRKDRLLRRRLRGEE